MWEKHTSLPEKAFLFRYFWLAGQCEEFWHYWMFQQKVDSTLNWNLRQYGSSPVFPINTGVSTGRSKFDGYRNTELDLSLRHDNSYICIIKMLDKITGWQSKNSFQAGISFPTLFIIIPYIFISPLPQTLPIFRHTPSYIRRSERRFSFRYQGKLIL